MKRVFIVSLLVLLFSVALVAAIEYDPGYVLLSYGQYTLETSIWVGGLVFLLLFFIVYGFFSLLRRVLSGSYALSAWFSDRGHRRSQQQTTRGLIAFIEGNWKKAQKVLARSAEKSETPLLNYLIAARASHALGESNQIKQYLKQAEQSASGAGIAVGLTQAELQLRSGHLEQSLATLMRVRKNADKHPYVLNLLKQVYVGLKDWSEVLALIPELRKYKVLAVEQLDKLELQASIASLRAISKLRSKQREELDKLWQHLPKAMKKNSQVVAAYVEQLIATGEMNTAEKQIRDQLKLDWSKELVTLYGKLIVSDQHKQLLHAENWLLERNNDATLFLCLGRLSLRNELWGKAREYFESSLKLENSGEVCAELGRLMAHLGDHEKSSEYFQKGLLLTTHGLQELPMPKN